MDRDELLQILQEETDEFTEQSRLRDDVLDALEKVQEKAINYTHCCESDSEQLVCDKCYDTDGFYLGTTCPKCKQPFRSVKAN